MGTLTDVQRVQYENEVKHAYQSIGSALENTVRVKSAPQAGTYQFRKFGKLEMVPRGAYRSLLEAVETNHELVPCTATDYVLPVLTDEFEQAKSGGEAPQEQKESAMAIALAMKRQRDYSVIAALDAGTPENTVTCGSGLTVAKLREGLIHFDKYEMRAGGDPVGGGCLYMAITEIQHDELLADALTQSIDTSNFKSLVDGKITEFCGYNFILIGTGRGSLGLGASGGVRRCYAWVKSAMGQAVSIEPRIKSGYELMYTSDVTVGQLSLGSTMVDARGVVQFDCTE